MTWGTKKRELKRKEVSARKTGGKLEVIYTNLRVQNPRKA